MTWKILLVTVIMIFSAVYSEDIFQNETIHIRVKRGKYYSYPSRFYRRPPMTYPTKGAFSYTPPPGYMMEDEEPQPNKPKVSKRPNDGLRDDDINNIVKYLSKQDLDKIIDLAGEKDRYRENTVERRPYKREESRIIKANVQDYTDQFVQASPYKNQESEHKFSLNGPFISREPESQFPNNFRSQDEYNGPYKPQNSEQLGPYRHEPNDKAVFNSPEHFNEPHRQDDQRVFNSPQSNVPYRHDDQRVFNSPLNEDLLNFVEDAMQSKAVYTNDGYSNIPLQTEESMQNKQISFLNTYIHREINDLPSDHLAHSAFTDSGTMREELLPRPVNLREDDIDISYTNNVPTVVKGPSYKVENFGDLPLMSNAHKLDTVSSYKVPHYTVTSAKHSPPPPQSSSYTSYSSSSSSANVPIEPAPSVSAAKEQSDAHLKAIKIWTHRSKGTAYTLHNDGTLSLERPKTKYGQK